VAIQALIQRPHDRLAGAELDAEGADDRGDEQTPPMASGSVIMFTSSGEVAKKIAASTMVATAVPHRSQTNRPPCRRSRRHCRRHVGDGGGIARIVFGNAGFDLAYEIATDGRPPLVKMPPPKTGQRSKSAKRRKPRATSGVDTDAVVGLRSRTWVR